MKVNLKFSTCGIPCWGGAWMLEIENNNYSVIYCYSTKPTSKQVRRVKKSIGGLKFSKFKI